MKKSLPFEIAATLLAILGAFLLVGVYMPLLNPEQTKIETHQELPSISYYIVLTPIPLFLLIAAWYFNKKARVIKQDSGESAHAPETPRQKKLKWILAGIVIVLVLFAFLW